MRNSEISGIPVFPETEISGISGRPFSRKLRGFSGTTVTVNGTHCLSNSCPWFCLSVKTLFNHLNIQYRGIRVFLHLLRETGKLFLKLNYFSLKEALTQKMDAQTHKSRVINQSRNSYFFHLFIQFYKETFKFQLNSLFAKFDVWWWWNPTQLQSIIKTCSTVKYQFQTFNP